MILIMVIIITITHYIDWIATRNRNTLSCKRFEMYGKKVLRKEYTTIQCFFLLYTNNFEIQKKKNNNKIENTFMKREENSFCRFQEKSYFIQYLLYITWINI